MKLQFQVTFKRGQKTVAVIDGDGKDAADLTVAEVTEKIYECEALLERLTGCRVHIEQIH